MKKRIWKRYLYLLVVGLAVYIGETRDEATKQGYVGTELVQAFSMEEELWKENQAAFEKENQLAKAGKLESQSEDLTMPTQEEPMTETPRAETQEEISPDGDMVDMEEFLREQQAARLSIEQETEQPISEQQTANAFIPHEKQFEYDWEALKDYKKLISTFYAIDASTASNESQLNIEVLTSKDMTIDKNLGPYQILIYHSHSKEAFADSRPGEKEDTIVGMGDILTQILTEQYGYGVLHHTGEYDTVRDDAYAVALPAIEKILSENPSIQVVIDLHRDAGISGVNRVTTMDGKEYATFMLFNGMSYLRKTGNIKYLANPNLADNLAFSFQMQVKAGEYYPGLTRKIYLKAYRYNMHLKPKTLLIELGDSNNTVQQVKNTIDPLAHILHMVISGE